MKPTAMQQKSIDTLWKAWEERGENTLMAAMGIEVDYIGPDKVTGKMPITPRVHQLYGILHGGALVAFAETLCSVAAYVHVDGDVNHCVGLEINANHVRSSVAGTAFGEAKPIHIGRTTQVWGIEIKNEEGKLLSVSRCTVAVVPHKK